MTEALPKTETVEAETEAGVDDAKRELPHWWPLVIGLVLLTLAMMLTWVSMHHASLFQTQINLVQKAMVNETLGTDGTIPPRPIDRSISRWMALGVAMMAILAAWLALKTKRLSTTIVLMLCVLLFFFTVLSGVFNL